ncbi:hypothetical protein XAC9322_200019 [Xanthomonas citri pv. citri]|nr:hypothetical protein XAC9322_200019 [Xanthomonas citri pv. citri]CEH37401.1 hypothetical protein XACLE3_2130005 [Xanthomonas citri pv. citri]CEH42508.1 hypothetical protein XACLG97_2570005 [Xanthomonas citri pv. citri]CEH44321.1 hypothetical protein XACG102_2430005 [Xanthomonas citri pv. citri]CEH65776.1 hypothetical protein XACS582_3080005 [Xanthomonas citri pv. citri]
MHDGDIQVRRVGHAECLGHHVAMRVRACLLAGQRALGDELLHIAVVLAQLRQPAIAPQVGAAVANPGHFETLAEYARGDHGGAHRQGVVAAARGLDDLFVGDAYRLGERGPGANFSHDGFARQCAGYFPAGMPPHAVGDQPQSQLAVAVIGVLVEVTAQADMGEVSEFEHGAGSPRRRCTTIIAARPVSGNTPRAGVAAPVHAWTRAAPVDAGPGRLWRGPCARMMHGPRTLGTHLERWQSG